MSETYGEHDRRIEDGAVRADEASEPAVGELLVSRPFETFDREVVDSPLPVLRLPRPAIPSEDAHLLPHTQPDEINRHDGVDG